MSTNEMTKGQERRLAKKQAAAAAKRKKTITICAVIAAVLVIVAIIAVVVINNAKKESDKLSVVTDFSNGLTEDGRIKGVNSAKQVTTIDPANLTVDYSKIEATDEAIQETIDSLLNSSKYFSEDASLEIKDGDTINLDYVGSVDGVEFEGGSTKGEGTTLTIGSGSYIDNFEEQLIGHKPGDDVIVKVTFPDPYTNNPDLAGKAAVFECKINSVQVTPEFTDELVAEKLADSDTNIKTAAEYRELVKKNLEDSNLKNYIQQVINEQSSAKGIPASYIKIARDLTYTNDLQTYTYYNNLYQQYLGYSMYNSFSEFTQMTEEEYIAKLNEEVKVNIAAQMAYEVLFDKLGLSITDAEYADYCKTIGENAEENFGKGYIMMTFIATKVINKLAETAVINK